LKLGKAINTKIKAGVIVHTSSISVKINGLYNYPVNQQDI